MFLIFQNNCKVDVFVIAHWILAAKMLICYIQYLIITWLNTLPTPLKLVLTSNKLVYTENTVHTSKQLQSVNVWSLISLCSWWL